VALLVGVALIALSAFFVAVEFALVAARRHRLAEAAPRSAGARAALRSSRDLSMLLAGAQLGITLCTLGLGAVAKPAVHDLLEPVLAGVGLPAAAADVVAFLLALVVVTFLHLVIGEMAPKSWAIAHPERSAILLAPAMRGFTAVVRPLLLALNGMANAGLRRFGVQPVDEVAGGHSPQTLRELVDHSARAGALDEDRRRRLLAALEIDTAAVRTLVRPDTEVAGVDADDPVSRVQEVSRESGHLRLLVRRAGAPVGVVHVRDTLDRDPATPVSAVSRPVLELPADEPVHRALTTMRQRRGHFALVVADGAPVGLLTLHDVLARLLPAPR
jgi:CBS domain containing-hemolysin-like protein